MATAVVADERTPLRRQRAGVGGDTHDDYWTTGRYLATAIVLPMLLIASMFGAFSVDHPTRGFRQGVGRGGVVEVTLHTNCVSSDTKSSMPSFFRPGSSIVGASIVRHDDKNPTGLGMEEGLAMFAAPPGPATGSEPGRFVASAEITGDWGFVLRNNFGESFYEIGEEKGAPMWGNTCSDARTFRQRLGKAVRTIVPGAKQLLLKDEEQQKAREFVFGSCNKRCPAETEKKSEKSEKAKRTEAQVKVLADTALAEKAAKAKKATKATEKATTNPKTTSSHPSTNSVKDSNAETPTAKKPGDAKTT